MSEKTILFYLSSTGNSLYTAKEIAKRYEQVDLIAIPDAIQNKQFKFEGYKKIGFVVPLYFFGIPPIAKRFIEQLEVPDSTYLFAIVTRAYSKGRVLTEINKLLKAKGKLLNYGRYLTFPDNYIRWAGAFKEEVQLSILKKAKKNLDLFSKEILSSTTIKMQEGYLIRTIALPLYAIWKSKLKNNSKTFKVSISCTSCEICERCCPTKNIIMNEGKPEWGQRCEDCMGCVQNCPQKAIYFNARTAAKRRYKNPNVSRSELLYTKTQ